VTEPLSIGQFGQVVARHWLLILGGLLLGGVAGFAVTQFMTPVYTATATQLVKGLPGAGPAANYEAAQYAVSRAKSYPTFIYSLSVLEGVRRDMGNAEDIIQLRKDLSATNPIDTPLVRISATGPTPQLARDKANSAARHMARFTTQIETVAGKSPIIVDTAVQAGLPTEPTSPKTLLVAALGAMVGLVLAIGASLIHAYAARRRQETRPQPEFDSALAKRAVDMTKRADAIEAETTETKTGAADVLERVEPINPSEAVKVGQITNKADGIDVAQPKETTEAIDSANAFEMREAVDPSVELEAVDSVHASNAAELWETVELEAVDSADTPNAVEPREAVELAAVLEAADTVDASNAGLSEWIPPWWISQAESTEVSNSADAVESRRRHGHHSDTDAEGYLLAATESEPNGAEAGQPQTGERSSAGQGRSNGTRVSAATSTRRSKPGRRGTPASISTSPRPRDRG
jgi:capsular polysaccharide biosynthesis protein